MQTLLLAPELFASDGGIPRILRLYLKALCEISAPGDRVHFVTLNDAVIDSADLRRYTDEHFAEWEACNRVKRDFIIAALKKSRSATRIVCGHVAQLPVAWAARCLNRRLQYFLIAHGIEVWRPFTLPQQIALRGAHRIFCISEYTRRELSKHCRLRPEQLVVLPNALDPLFGKPAATPTTDAASREPVILTISRLTRDDIEKGVDSMIMAMPQLLARRPRAKLRIIGRGNDLPRLQLLADELRLGKSVEFCGFVEDSVMRQHLADCALFALPSRKEGFGLVFLEAMAHGKPCLGANAGGIPEVIDASCGRLVPYGDTSAIAATCDEMLSATWDAATIRRRAVETFGFATFRENLARYLA